MKLEKATIEVTQNLKNSFDLRNSIYYTTEWKITE